MANKKTQRKREHKRPSSKLAKQELAIMYGYKCLLCGSREDLQYHHIIKFADGGETDVENGCLLCPSCHYRLHRNEQNEEKYNKEIRYKKKHFIDKKENQFYTKKE